MDYAAKVLRQSAVQGFKRLKNFRANRLRFIEAYVGSFYDKDSGVLGSEPLNMAFNAVRVLVPNLVSRNPKMVIDTDYLMYRQYGELLALALDYLSKKLKLPKILQRGIVDAIFTMGIFKVGLSTSNSLVYFGEEAVDPGQLYVETVDLDDFTFDPSTKYLDKRAGFLGERMRVERDLMLASGLFDNALVEKLPSSMDVLIKQSKAVRELSAKQLQPSQLAKLHDFVDLMELWLPDPEVLVTVPFDGPELNMFLREETFNGPDDGPYAFLSLTPPVPGNPLPVGLAGIWHDLHYVTNRIAKKTMDQALAQKDILGYQRQYADDAQEIVEAKNLDAVAMADPTSAAMYSFGGQNPRNEQMLAQLGMWFNQMSGNLEMIGGTGMETKVATVANILQQGAATGVTYMRDQVYETTTDILRKCAWYLHTDPLIQLPLIRRETIPAEYEITDEQVRMISPARTDETQVFFSPEVRNGDFLDFAFSIQQDSMGPINWQHRLQQLEMLAVRIFPAAAAAAQIAAQMGTPFSFSAFIIRAAKLMNIDWIDEIFQSPELVAQMAMIARQGPQMQNSQGVAAAPAVRQNGGATVGQTAPGEQTRNRQKAQSGAGQIGLHGEV